MSEVIVRYFDNGYGNVIGEMVGELVRCKECRYRAGKINAKGFEVCEASGMDITDDDFCSYGERSSDEQ